MSDPEDNNRKSLPNSVGLESNFIDGRCNVYQADETLDILLDRRNYMIEHGVRPAHHYARPLKVQLDFTSFCNLDCCFCYNASGRGRHEELSEAQLDRIWGDLIQSDVLEVILSGGEVFCRPKKLFGILDRIKDQNMGARIVTNGWMVDERCAMRLGRYPVYDVQVSIDGADPVAHDKIRGRVGSWQRAVQCVAALSRGGIPVSIACVLNKQNWKTIPNLVEIGYALGAKRLVFADLINVGRANAVQTILYLDDDSYETCYEMISDLRKQYMGRMGVQISTDIGVAMRMSLKINDTICYIRPDGRVCPSCMIPVVFGDAREEPLGRIWKRMLGLDQNPQVAEFMDQFKTHATPTLNLSRSTFEHSDNRSWEDQR